MSDELHPLVAAFGDNPYAGKNSFIYRRMRALLQRRDDEGQFAEQGGMGGFNVRRPDGTVFRALGEYVGESGNTLENSQAVFYVKNDPNGLPDGFYLVNGDNFRSYGITLDLPEGTELRDVTGDAAKGAQDIDALVRLNAPPGWEIFEENGVRGFQTEDKEMRIIPPKEEGGEWELYRGKGKAAKAKNKSIGELIDAADDLDLKADLTDEAANEEFKSIKNRKAKAVKGLKSTDPIARERAREEMDQVLEEQAKLRKDTPLAKITTAKTEEKITTGLAGVEKAALKDKIKKLKLMNKDALDKAPVGSTIFVDRGGDRGDLLELRKRDDGRWASAEGYAATSEQLMKQVRRKGDDQNSPRDIRGIFNGPAPRDVNNKLVGKKDFRETFREAIAEMREERAAKPAGPTKEEGTTTTTTDKEAAPTPGEILELGRPNGPASKKLVKKLREHRAQLEAEGNLDDATAKRIDEIINTLEDPNTNRRAYAITDENGVPTGAMLLRKEKGGGGAKLLGVDSLYTMGGGGDGTRLMQKAAQVALDEKSSLITIGAVESAKPFYAKLGGWFLGGPSPEGTNPDSLENLSKYGTASWDTEHLKALAEGNPIDATDDNANKWLKGAEKEKATTTETKDADAKSKWSQITEAAKKLAGLGGDKKKERDALNKKIRSLDADWDLQEKLIEKRKRVVDTYNRAQDLTPQQLAELETRIQDIDDEIIALDDRRAARLANGEAPSTSEDVPTSWALDDENYETPLIEPAAEVKDETQVELDLTGGEEKKAKAGETTTTTESQKDEDGLELNPDFIAKNVQITTDEDGNIVAIYDPGADVSGLRLEVFGDKDKNKVFVRKYNRFGHEVGTYGPYDVDENTTLEADVNKWADFFSKELAKDHKNEKFAFAYETQDRKLTPPEGFTESVDEFGNPTLGYDQDNVLASVYVLNDGTGRVVGVISDRDGNVIDETEPVEVEGTLNETLEEVATALLARIKQLRDSGAIVPVTPAGENKEEKKKEEENVDPEEVARRWKIVDDIIDKMRVAFGKLKPMDFWVNFKEAREAMREALENDIDLFMLNDMLGIAYRYDEFIRTINARLEDMNMPDGPQKEGIRAFVRDLEGRRDEFLALADQVRESREARRREGRAPNTTEPVVAYPDFNDLDNFIFNGILPEGVDLPGYVNPDGADSGEGNSGKDGEEKKPGQDKKPGPKPTPPGGGGGGTRPPGGGGGRPRRPRRPRRPYVPSEPPRGPGDGRLTKAQLYILMEEWGYPIARRTSIHGEIYWTDGYVVTDDGRGGFNIRYYAGSYLDPKERTKFENKRMRELDKFLKKRGLKTDQFFYNNSEQGSPAAASENVNTPGDIPPGTDLDFPSAPDGDGPDNGLPPGAYNGPDGAPNEPGGESAGSFQEGPTVPGTEGRLSEEDFRNITEPGTIVRLVTSMKSQLYYGWAPADYILGEDGQWTVDHIYKIDDDDKAHEPSSLAQYAKMGKVFLVTPATQEEQQEERRGPRFVDAEEETQGGDTETGTSTGRGPSSTQQRETTTTTTEESRKITPDEFSLRTTDEDYEDLTKSGKPMPNQEQRNVIDAIYTAVGDAASGIKKIVVQALAGTGKTTTLVAAANILMKKVPDARGLYVAFNKKIQIEALGRMPVNTDVRTGDSLAVVAMKDIAPEFMKNRFLKGTKRQDDIAAMLQLEKVKINDENGEALTPSAIANRLKKVVHNYAISEDDQISESHFTHPIDGELLPFNDETLRLAQELWADIQDPQGISFVDFEDVMKMWALTRPDLAQVVPGGTRTTAADFIFFDEAQDINPVMARVIRDQKVPVIYVGDKNQAIYGFRGASNELGKVQSEVELPLQTTYRMAQELAGPGNRFLSLLMSAYKIIGGGRGTPEIFRDGEMSDPDVVIARTNIGAFSAALKMLDEGRRVGLSEDTISDMQIIINHFRSLRDRTPRPPRLNDELAPYATWQAVLDAIDEGEASDALKRIVRMMDGTNQDEESGLQSEFDDVIIEDLLSRAVPIKDDSTGGFTGTAGDVGTTADGNFRYSVQEDEDGNLVFAVSSTYAETPEKKEAQQQFIADVLKPEGFKGTGRNNGPRISDWDGTGDPPQFSYILKASSKDALMSVVRGAFDGRIEMAPETIMITAHKSKGLEWDRVRLADDWAWFKPKPQISKQSGALINTIYPSREELRIAYVAATRAKKALDLGGASWIFDYTLDSDEDPNSPSRGIPEGDTFKPGYGDDVVEQPTQPTAAPTPGPTRETKKPTPAPKFTAPTNWDSGDLFDDLDFLNAPDFDEEITPQFLAQNLTAQDLRLAFTRILKDRNNSYVNINGQNVPVPPKTVYNAIAEQGMDPRRVQAEIYDAAMGGTTNVDALEEYYNQNPELRPEPREEAGTTTTANRGVNPDDLKGLQENEDFGDKSPTTPEAGDDANSTELAVEQPLSKLRNSLKLAIQKMASKVSFLREGEERKIYAVNDVRDALQKLGINTNEFIRDLTTPQQKAPETDDNSPASRSQLFALEHEYKIRVVPEDLRTAIENILAKENPTAGEAKWAIETLRAQPYKEAADIEVNKRFSNNPDIGDPETIISAIKEAYPEHRVMPNGDIIIETFEETHYYGSEYEYDLVVTRTSNEMFYVYLVERSNTVTARRKNAERIRAARNVRISRMTHSAQSLNNRILENLLELKGREQEKTSRRSIRRFMDQDAFQPHMQNGEEHVRVDPIRKETVEAIRAASNRAEITEELVRFLFDTVQKYGATEEVLDKIRQATNLSVSDLNELFDLINAHVTEQDQIRKFRTWVSEDGETPLFEDDIVMYTINGKYYRVVSRALGRTEKRRQGVYEYTDYVRAREVEPDGFGGWVNVPNKTSIWLVSKRLDIQETAEGSPTKDQRIGPNAIELPRPDAPTRGTEFKVSERKQEPPVVDGVAVKIDRTNPEAPTISVDGKTFPVTLTRRTEVGDPDKFELVNVDFGDVAPGDILKMYDAEAKRPYFVEVYNVSTGKDGRVTVSGFRPVDLDNGTVKDVITYTPLEGGAAGIAAAVYRPVEKKEEEEPGKATVEQIDKLREYFINADFAKADPELIGRIQEVLGSSNPTEKFDAKYVSELIKEISEVQRRKADERGEGTFGETTGIIDGVAGQGGEGSTEAKEASDEAKLKDNELGGKQGGQAGDSTPDEADYEFADWTKVDYSDTKAEDLKKVSATDIQDIINQFGLEGTARDDDPEMGEKEKVTGAQSIKKLMELASEQYKNVRHYQYNGVNVFVSKNYTPEATQKLLNHVKGLQDTNPITRKDGREQNIWFVESRDGGLNGGITSGNGDIMIPVIAEKINDPNYRPDPAKYATMMPALAELGPNGNVYQYLLAHEWGHAIALSDGGGYSFTHKVKEFYTLLQDEKSVMELVSEYGKSNMAEMFAELWAQNYFENFHGATPVGFSDAIKDFFTNINKPKEVPTTLTLRDGWTEDSNSEESIFDTITRLDELIDDLEKRLKDEPADKLLRWRGELSALKRTREAAIQARDTSKMYHVDRDYGNERDGLDVFVDKSIQDGATQNILDTIDDLRKTISILPGTIKPRSIFIVNSESPEIDEYNNYRKVTELKTSAPGEKAMSVDTQGNIVLYVKDKFTFSPDESGTKGESYNSLNQEGKAYIHELVVAWAKAADATDNRTNIVGGTITERIARDLLPYAPNLSKMTQKDIFGQMFADHFFSGTEPAWMKLISPKFRKIFTASSSELATIMRSLDKAELAAFRQRRARTLAESEALLPEDFLPSGEWKRLTSEEYFQAVTEFGDTALTREEEREAERRKDPTASGSLSGLNYRQQAQNTVQELKDATASYLKNSQIYRFGDIVAIFPKAIEPEVVKHNLDILSHINWVFPIGGTFVRYMNRSHSSTWAHSNHGPLIEAYKNLYLYDMMYSEESSPESEFHPEVSGYLPAAWSVMTHEWVHGRDSTMPGTHASKATPSPRAKTWLIRPQSNKLSQLLAQNPGWYTKYAPSKYATRSYNEYLAELGLVVYSEDFLGRPRVERPQELTDLIREMYSPEALKVALENDRRREQGEPLLPPKDATTLNAPAIDEDGAIESVWKPARATALAYFEPLKDSNVPGDFDYLKAHASQSLADSLTSDQSTSVFEAADFMGLDRMVEAADLTMDNITTAPGDDFVDANTTGVLKIDAYGTLTVTKLSDFMSQNGMPFDGDGTDIPRDFVEEFLSDSRNNAAEQVVLAGTPAGNKAIIASAASALIRDWADVLSGSGGALNREIQYAAAQMFPETLDNSAAIDLEVYDLNTKEVDPFVMAAAGKIYDLTQQFFRDRGITEVTIYRGAGNIDEDILAELEDSPQPTSATTEIVAFPISSWTTNQRVAWDFAQSSTNSAVIRRTVPVSQIFSIPLYGIGTYGESELVALGGRITGEIQPTDTWSEEGWSNIPTDPVFLNAINFDDPQVEEVVNSTDLNSAEKEEELRKLGIDTANKPADGSLSMNFEIAEYLWKPAYTLLNNEEYIRLTNPVAAEIEGKKPLVSAFEELDRRSSTYFSTTTTQEAKSHVASQISKTLAEQGISWQDLYGILKDGNKYYLGDSDYLEVYGGSYGPDTENVSAIPLFNYIQGDKKLQKIDAEALLAGSDGTYDSLVERVAAYNELNGPSDRVSIPGTPEFDALALEAMSSLMISSWAGSSTAGRLAEAVQAVAQEMFDTNEFVRTFVGIKQPIPVGEEYTPIIKAFLTAQYDATQKLLQEQGITEIRLYRGLSGIADSEYQEYVQGKQEQGESFTTAARANPLSSWTTEFSVAEDFAVRMNDDWNGVVLEATIPAANIFSIPMTGFGALVEREVVVIGRDQEVSVILGEDLIDDYEE